MFFLNIFIWSLVIPRVNLAVHSLGYLLAQMYFGARTGMHLGWLIGGRKKECLTSVAWEGDDQSFSGMEDEAGGSPLSLALPSMLSLGSRNQRLAPTRQADGYTLAPSPPTEMLLLENYSHPGPSLRPCPSR